LQLLCCNTQYAEVTDPGSNKNARRDIIAHFSVIAYFGAFDDPGRASCNQWRIEIRDLPFGDIADKRVCFCKYQEQ